MLVLDFTVFADIRSRMGRNCIVAGCTNTQKNGLSLFKFPADDELRKL